MSQFPDRHDVANLRVRRYQDCIDKLTASGDSRFITHLTKEQILAACNASDLMVVVERNNYVAIGYKCPALKMPGKNAFLSLFVREHSEIWQLVPENGSSVSYHVVLEGDMAVAMPVIDVFKHNQCFELVMCEVLELSGFAVEIRA